MTDEDCVTVFSPECHPACAGLPYLFYPAAVFLFSFQCDNNCPCVIKLNGEVTFKMFYENDTEIQLSSLNEKYPDIIIRKDSKVDFKVIGKVVDMIPKL